MPLVFWFGFVGSVLSFYGYNVFGVMAMPSFNVVSMHVKYIF